jgi:hypothetical protein
VAGKTNPRTRPNDWNLVLRTGYGNIFATGRWDDDGITLIAEAINSGGNWDDVEEWASIIPWDERFSN